MHFQKLFIFAPKCNRVIRNFTILTDEKRVEKPVVAFIFIVIQYGDGVKALMEYIEKDPDVLECYAVTGFGMSSREVAEYILERTHVVTSPGDAFGPDGEGYIRICYASKYEQLKEALERMERAFGTK